MGWFRRGKKKEVKESPAEQPKQRVRKCRYCEMLSGGVERAKKMNYCEQDKSVQCLLKPVEESA